MSPDTTILETERLHLRELFPQDINGLLRIFSDPEAMTFYSKTKDRDETAEWIESNRRSYAKNGFGLWAAITKDTEDFVGGIAS